MLNNIPAIRVFICEYVSLLTEGAKLKQYSLTELFLLSRSVNPLTSPYIYLVTLESQTSLLSNAVLAYNSSFGFCA